ncbi:MAG: VWA domain-containing protein [Bryobacteraceae bacterium]
MGRIRPQKVIRRAACFLVFAVCLSAPGWAQDPPTTFKVNVRLVRLLATVKDANGQLISSLNKSDFTVYDNGVPQEVAVFDRQTAQPLSVAAMVDSSASTGIELRYELESMRKFFKTLLFTGNPLDTAALYSFNWEVTLLGGYTRRFARLETSLKQVHSEGGTSMYDAIFLASRNLELRDGRHVMVIVTDGGDTTSTKNYHQALQAAQMADVVIYPVLVMPITNDAGRNIGGENALTTLSAGTGGRMFRPSAAAELDRAFAEILLELRTQYLIGYYPRDVPPSSDRFHTLKVDVRGRNLRVITRSGYYGEFNESTKGMGR